MSDQRVNIHGTGSPLQRALSWMFGATAITGFLNFIAIAWFARVLGVSEMGAYAQLVIALELVAAILSFGFNQALIRIPNDPELRAAVMVATVLQAAAFILLAALTLFSVLHPQWTNERPLLVVGSLLVFSRALGWFTFVLDAQLRAAFNYRAIALAQLAGAAFGIVIGVVMAHKGFGILALVIRDMSASILIFCIFAVRYKEQWRFHAPKGALSRLWKYTAPLWSLNALERVALRLDYVVIGWSLGRDALGLYFAIRSMAEGILGFLISPIQTAVYTFYCRIPNPEAFLAKIVRLAPMAAIATTMAAALIYALDTEHLVHTILGPGFSPGYVLLPGMLVYVLCALWFENLKVLAMALSMHGRAVIGRLIQIGILAMITWPLTYVWGLLGAGIATGVGALALACGGTLGLARRHVAK
jgi:O-antigen/teichoic acid export membrane protein